MVPSQLEPPGFGPWEQHGKGGCGLKSLAAALASPNTRKKYKCQPRILLVLVLALTSWRMMRGGGGGCVRKKDSALYRK